MCERARVASSDSGRWPEVAAGMTREIQNARAHVLVHASFLAWMTCSSDFFNGFGAVIGVRAN